MYHLFRNSHKANYVRLFIALMLTLFAFDSFAQCKSVAKKCMPRLSPYIYTGQLNSTSIYEGESAELIMTLTGGQQYRILTCGSTEIGNLRFLILDSRRKVIFNNKDHGNTQSWDLNVGSSDDYTIQVSMLINRNQTAGESPKSGCVAILVGFKNE